MVSSVGMESRTQPLKASGTIWRWDRKRATGMVETLSGEHIWFGLDSIIGRDFGTISLGDSVEVEYEHANQDSHKLRAIKITWL